jgi:hypothetical protein
MTQGVFVNGLRPKSKKAIKDALIAGDDVVLQATSFFGNEYSGPVTSAPDGTYTFVGPSPEKRVFFGNFFVKAGKVTCK